MTTYSIKSLVNKVRADKIAAANAAHITRVAELKDWAASQKWDDVRWFAFHAVPVGDELTLSLLADIDFLIYEKIISAQSTVLDWPFIGPDKDRLLTLVAEGKYKDEQEEARGYY